MQNHELKSFDAAFARMLSSRDDFRDEINGFVPTHGNLGCVKVKADGSLSVDWQHYKVTAHPRSVKTGKDEKDFATEYVFRIGADTESIEVARLYLSCFQELYQTFDDLDGDTNKLSYANVRRIGGVIYDEVLSGLLQSSYFEATIQRAG